MRKFFGWVIMILFGPLNIAWGVSRLGDPNTRKQATYNIGAGILGTWLAAWMLGWV